MRSSVIAFTARGQELAERAADFLRVRGGAAETARGWGEGKAELSLWTREAFSSSDALVFVGAAGICVRAVAPYVKSKASDPAVVVLSEDGRWAIPLLSGHLGGANRLAAALAEALGAQLVLTTATDTRGVFAADSWAVSQGLAVANPEAIRRVSGRLLAGQTVLFYSDEPVAGALPQNLQWADGPAQCALYLSPVPCPNPDALWLVPPVLALGVGARRGAEASALRGAAEAALREAGMDARAVFGVFSAELKKDEPGILDFCRSMGLPFTTYTADELNAVPGAFHGSAFVRSVAGTDSVCERSAVLGAGGGPLVCPKLALGGATAALARRRLSITFQED